MLGIRKPECGFYLELVPFCQGEESIKESEATMAWSFRLFRVKGIDVKIHLIFVLILVWAAYRWGSDSGQGVEGALFGWRN